TGAHCVQQGTLAPGHKHYDGVRRWFLDRLQESVLCWNVESFGIVDNRNTALTPHRLYSQPFYQVAHLFDQNFCAFRAATHIDEIGMPTGGDLDACRKTIPSSRRPPTCRTACTCPYRAVPRGATRVRSRRAFAQNPVSQRLCNQCFTY